MDRVTYEKTLKNFNKMYIVFSIAILIILVLIGGSLASILSNDVKVRTDSDIIYYLNISYDGVDKYGIVSSDSTISEIRSGYLYVEDKIPDDLEFLGFVTTSDGSIGAVKRSDNSSCLGKVVDDTEESVVNEGVWNNSNTEYTYHGLHYNSNTRTVSFRIKNLNAGCKVVVGIKVKTPKKIDDLSTKIKEKRRDFYTFASVRENYITSNSDVIHFYMGDEFAKLYKVSYEYEGEVPDNAPVAPRTLQYISGVNVSTLKNIDLYGYEFSGWTSDDVDVKDGRFIMPSSDIVLKGSFVKKDSYKVNYKIDGDMPDGYVIPDTVESYVGNYIDVDSLAVGTIINGYRFNGWSSSDVLIKNDGSFEMPEKDVYIKGSFEKAKYNVIYKFYDTVLPNNSEKYLPDIKSYDVGDIVNLSDVENVDGYKFLGWYKKDKFIMPNSDITVYGEWKEVKGTFEPKITITNLSKKKYYRIGDVINYVIVITNDSLFDIRDVTLKSDTDFLDSDDYSLLSEGVLLIDNIPSSSSITLYSNYVVKKSDVGKVNNYVEVIDASSDNGYELADNIKRNDIDLNLESLINICQKVEGVVVTNNFQYHILGDNNYNTWINLKNNECKSVNVIPGKYFIKQIISQEYYLDSFNGLSSDYSVVVDEESTYDVLFTNKFKNKLFFHGYGRSSGVVIGGDKDESKNKD